VIGLVDLIQVAAGKIPVQLALGVGIDVRKRIRLAVNDDDQLFDDGSPDGPR